MEKEEDRLSNIIIGAAIEVHKVLGAGLLESAYEECLCHELRNRGLSVERQKCLPVSYIGNQLDCGHRLNIVVENLVTVELKTVDRIEDIHEAQLLTYLKLSGVKLGLLINFNTLLLHKGTKRIVNNL